MRVKRRPSRPAATSAEGPWELDVGAAAAPAVEPLPNDLRFNATTGTCRRVCGLMPANNYDAPGCVRYTVSGAGSSVVNGEYQLVYASPEKLLGSSMVGALAELHRRRSGALMPMSPPGPTTR